eukprot:6829702-Pyramimonas_sp.AAC.1
MVDVEVASWTEEGPRGRGRGLEAAAARARAEQAGAPWFMAAAMGPPRLAQLAGAGGAGVAGSGVDREGLGGDELRGRARSAGFRHGVRPFRGAASR